VGERGEAPTAFGAKPHWGSGAIICSISDLLGKYLRIREDEKGKGVVGAGATGGGPAGKSEGRPEVSWGKG